VNFVAWLAVLAATSFALPLLVQGCQALGLPRGASVAVSLVVAGGALLLWLARALGRARKRARAADGARAAGAAEGGAAHLRDIDEDRRASV